jgi:hypothetical protein
MDIGQCRIDMGRFGRETREYCDLNMTCWDRIKDDAESKGLDKKVKDDKS